MAYDEGLAQRIEEILGSHSGMSEQKMFGGIGYLLNGNMAVGVHGESLIVRVGPDKHLKARENPYTKEFDFTGRAMKGWVMVSPEGIQEDEDLNTWVSLGTEFAESLPPK